MAIAIVTGGNAGIGRAAAVALAATDRQRRARRPGDAREVGALIAFLSSPEMGYVTGQFYVVDGGTLLTTAQMR
jgi:NAD(P)-dependent dehydrogenase (short-subunit alcohol dehydrogenase family)